MSLICLYLNFSSYSPYTNTYTQNELKVVLKVSKYIFSIVKSCLFIFKAKFKFNRKTNLWCEMKIV